MHIIGLVPKWLQRSHESRLELFALKKIGKISVKHGKCLSGASFCRVAE